MGSLFESPRGICERIFVFFGWPFEAVHFSVEVEYAIPLGGTFFVKQRMPRLVPGVLHWFAVLREMGEHLTIARCFCFPAFPFISCGGGD